MKRFFIIVLSVLIFSAAEAQAQSCYSPRQFEAEQGLRIHSELMVIGLTCAKMPGGQNLYSDYQMFTRKNQHLISGYETDIISFFQAQGKPHPEKALHSLRTSLANQISQHAIKMSTKSFCHHFGPRIQKALSMDQGKLRKWAQHVWAETPTTMPVCARS